MNYLGSWRAERYWLQSPPLSCYMTGVLEIFLQRSTIALLSIGSLMSLTVYIYPHQGIACFHPTSKDGLCGAHGREMEAYTCVTYVTKSNNGSMEMTNHTSWSRSCTYVEGGWWNAILLLWISLSFIWITWGHGYIIVYLSFFSWTFMCPFFCVMLIGHAIFFFDSPCLIWRILEREIIKPGVLFCGWMKWHS